MYIISELEKQEENILKLDKKELKKNVLYWYWLDATTGFAWFLGGQAWLDDHGINIMSKCVPS